MFMDPIYRELLYKFFDGELSPRESDELEKALKGDAGFMQEKEKIKQTRESVKSIAAQSFSDGFIDRVMNRISNNESSFDNVLYRLFKPLAVAASFLIVAILSYNISTSDQLSLENALAIPDISITETADLVYLSDLME
jgi:anti-sigma factor RsiW